MVVDASVVQVMPHMPNKPDLPCVSLHHKRILLTIIIYTIMDYVMSMIIIIIILIII